MKRTAAAIALLCTSWTPSSLLAQTINTIAGTGSTGLTGDGGLAVNATMTSPKGLVLAPGGVLFADDGTHTIRKIGFVTGTIERVAGTGALQPVTEGANPLSSGLAQPRDLAYDASGNLLILEGGQGRVLRITAANTIERVAGTGAPGGGGDGGPALFASLDDVSAMDTDAAGNIYVLEKSMGRVRKIDAGTGIITTVAGNRMRGFSWDGGLATNALFNVPEGLAVTAAGDLYIVETGNRPLRFVSASTGVINTVAGGGSLPGDGPANLVSFNSFRDALPISEEQKGDITSAAAESSCGHKNQATHRVKRE